MPPSALPELFSWDVTSPNVGRAGPGGVSDDEQRAVGALREALLREAPGARGEVWSVHLGAGMQAGYVADGLVATARRDRRSRVIVENPL
ncbi:hypothetical protein [Actinomadura roseirufa]|uniref:hypothetical protein n=1 Tax=Actinomadura roseirufa TaxID=2094049 RepID=UPI0010417E38|nr:hypothetical protein [Actinomadura roseirufa]